MQLDIGTARRADQKHTNQKPPHAANKIAGQDIQHTKYNKHEPESGTRARGDTGRPAYIPVAQARLGKSGLD